MASPGSCSWRIVEKETHLEAAPREFSIILRKSLTRELLLEDGGEGGQQVLQQLRQPALEQPWGVAVRLRLHHHLAATPASVKAEKAAVQGQSLCCMVEASVCCMPKLASSCCSASIPLRLSLSLYLFWEEVSSVAQADEAITSRSCYMQAYSQVLYQACIGLSTTFPYRHTG